MNKVLSQDYTQAKENLSKAQEKALEIIVKKDDEVSKIQDEIKKILQENNLNLFDIDKYKHDKNINHFLKIELP
jgi:predicted DNA-binding ArsR family transcriptional regulator